ncbi:hypothetical protein C8046_10710 [Serinibacter arcticus]|uniref:DUF664 domain-containing protein n=1 Tax=Serinibacter arcticus TaxID=1655435 RepID=A0A2U1ZVP9_9MICO|nr:DUF664 domain-containing protein [Serinibacter arcticus]PWD51049.1 hypothetical protein C8046_10710 [Serinibacter arcticus]
MRSTDVLADAFGRIPDLIHHALDGADHATLTRRLDPATNTLAWLAWHTGREQDAQIAALAGTPEVWVSDGWARRAALDLPDDDMGYGHDAAHVERVDAPADVLLGYATAVEQAARTYLAGLADDDLDVVVDEDWDPPVTLGARLVSVVGDALEHAGQAAFLRGVLDRAR